MRVLIQRVAHANVEIDGKIKGKIDRGLLLLLGIEADDNENDIQWLCPKIVNMRIFNDQEGKMNLSINKVEGSILLISQFTLHASTKKGNRPSYVKAARPEQAISLYESFISTLEKQFGKRLETGVFGADMKVNLLNDGPVTIMLDSKNKE